MTALQALFTRIGKAVDVPTNIVLYTRDLRVADHPALAAAAGDAAVPLFVLDPQVLAVSARNRISYLAQALQALDRELRRRGAGLVLRRGDTVTTTIRLAAAVGAEHIHLSDDVSSFAAQRLSRLRAEARPLGIAVHAHPGVTVVPAGELRPSGGADHYKVFTPYWKAWEAMPWRDPAITPDRLRLPEGLDPGGAALPDPESEGTGQLSPDRQRGGVHAAEERQASWLEHGIGTYADRHDDLAAGGTSRLSADLRFGCLSPLLLAQRARQAEGGDPFARQLAWRDFHHQVAHAFPELPRRNYRRPPGTADWRWDEEDAFQAWCAGETGVPIVDAGMRQLLREGFMHNRARMITAAFLLRQLNVHWKRGADHFHALLTDGDIANNYGNWQWTAGTGNDTRPNRPFNPLRQARRFDPAGEYVRRYVPELAEFGHREGLRPGAVHEPWRTGQEAANGYPPPLVAMD